MAPWTRETPWRQGHLITGAAFAALLAERAADGHTIAIVVSHDCDIVQDPDKEPHVEVITGTIVAAAGGQYTFGKNARKLHLALQKGQGEQGEVEGQGGQELIVELTATDKATIAKALLADHMPSGWGTGVDGRDTLQSWLAARYRRSAFPEAFNARLRKVEDKLGSILKQQGAAIPAVFFDLGGGRDAELPAEQPYDLTIYVLYSLGEDAEAELKATDVAARIEQAFKAKYCDAQGNWTDIELASCTAVSVEAISYAQVQQLQRWRADHVSLANAEPVAAD